MKPKKLAGSQVGITKQTAALQRAKRKQMALENPIVRLAKKLGKKARRFCDQKQKTTNPGSQGTPGGMGGLGQN